MKLKRINDIINKSINKFAIKNLIAFIFILLSLLMIIEKRKIINKLNNSFSYFSCFITIAKLENKYVRELVEYYIKLGIDKFYIGDDNTLNSEKISDVLQDYIKNEYVEILDIRNQNFTQQYFFEYTFDIYKSKCAWILYFDIDEYLEFSNKNLTIKKYLSQKRFNQCDVIKLNWLMFYDNNLLYYDNRSLQTRFPKPNFYKEDMRTVKSIVRGNSKRNPWINNSGPHEPAPGLRECNSLGEKSVYGGGMQDPPIYKYAYLKHYSIKSTEEFGYKIKKGLYNGGKFDIDNRINYYFKHNKFTFEKLSILEKIFNTTFLNFHKKNGIK